MSNKKRTELNIKQKKILLYEDILKIRNSAPLIHNITNFVVMNNTANALLAIGASPVMAHAKEEMEEMTSIAGALVINIGTLNPDWVDAMIIAGKTACKRGIPIVLDPVGAGATSYRTDTCVRIMSECMPSIIRGNGSEIMVLEQAYSKYLNKTGGKSYLSGGKEKIKSKGVDSTASSNLAVDSAKRLAKITGGVVSISGETDYITDGEVVNTVSVGSSMMTKVTGLGCTASAITGAFAAVNKNYLEAATNAMLVMGIAGQSAASRSAGPGTLQLRFLDELYNIDRFFDTENRAGRLFKTPLYLVTDRHFFGLDDSIPDDKIKLDNLLEEAVIKAVKGGVGMVQLREKDCSEGEFVYLAERLHRILKLYDIPLIINDNIDVASRVDAEGVHIGQSDASVNDARMFLSEDKIVGLSVENMQQAIEANNLDVDYIAVSPLFQTPTKTDTGEGFGLDGLANVALFSTKPVVAIGGISCSNASDVMAAGADSIAVVSAIMDSKDPQRSATDLLDRCIGKERAWRERAWSNIQPIYSEIINMPFLRDLEKGTLKQEAFVYYLAQDTLYLKIFGDNMLKMGKMKELECYKEYFDRFYNETMLFEDMLHQTLREKMKGVSLTEKEIKTMGMACRVYTDHLCKFTKENSAAKALAAHLACFWVYAEVGKQLVSTPDNIYKEWIDGYGSEQFEDSVRIYLDICCSIASKLSYKDQQEMIDIFQVSTQMEYHFWNYAYECKK